MAINSTTQQSYDPFANQSLSTAGMVGVGSVNPEGNAALNQSYDEFGGAVLGAVGSGIDRVGQALGNPLPNFDISENLERLGGMLNPAPVQAADFNEAAYRERGWTDTDAMKADYDATGGPQAPAPAPTTYKNPYTKENVTTKPGEAPPSPWDMFGGAYPESNYQDFAGQHGNPEGYMAEVDSEYQQKLGYLSKAEQAIRDGQPEILEQIAADLKAGRSLSEAGKSKELGALSLAEQKAQTGKETALDSARRLYNELRMGVGQKYGKLSNVGEVANVLLGREQQTQMGKTRSNFQQTVAEVDQARADVESTFKAQDDRLFADSQAASGQANQEFRARLDEVDANRLLASTERSQQKLGLLNDLRDKVFEINATRDQFRKQLEMQKQQQLLDLDTYTKQLQESSKYGQGAVNTFLGENTPNPKSDLTVTGKESVAPMGIEQARGYAGPQSYNDLPAWMQGQY